MDEIVVPSTSVSPPASVPTTDQEIPLDRLTLVNEIKETADKLARDHATRGDLKILSRVLRELRYAFKVFTPYRLHRKVTVFGSARTQPGTVIYGHAVEFGRKMAEAGWMVVTGAGGGIMEAGHVGAGKQHSMGVNIMLPFEQEPNYVINRDEKLIHLKYFFTRKLLFVKEVHAIVLFPGGFGTQDEGFETLTLVQTGKRDPLPIVCVDEPGGTYWSAWRELIVDQLLNKNLISPPDMSLFKVTSSVDEAVSEVLNFYGVYNSQRYVKKKLVLRLHTEPTAVLVDRLNSEFRDIVEAGRIEKSGPLPLEADEPHLEHLPRLVFQFNRRDFGRLRQLIDVINVDLRESLPHPTLRP